MPSLEEVLLNLDVAYVQALGARCLPLRHRQADCRRCVEVCPLGAITVEEGLRVDKELCEGCGLCVAVCPTEALILPGDAGLVLDVRKEAPGRRLLFSCQAEGEGDPTVLKVPCIGRLTPALILLALGSGAREVLLDEGRCEGCRFQAGRQLAHAAVERASRVMDMLEWPEIAAEPSSEDPSAVNRRGFFSGVGRKVGEIAARALIGDEESPEDASRSLLHVPAERRLLAAAVRKLRIIEGRADCEGSPYTPRTAVAGCDGCGVCGRFCPTGSLVVRDEPEWRLEFSVSGCVGCELCTDLCPKDALVNTTTVRRELLDGGRVTLVRSAKRTCTACGQNYHQAGDLCPACGSERDLETDLEQIAGPGRG